MSLELDNIISLPTNRPIFAPEAPSYGPIEQKMRDTLSTLKDTKYPDTFDWSIYDKIASRFDEPPRGGVVFNTGLKLVNHHSSCTKCHYAFEIDTYGRGCLHNCVYCYAKEILTRHGYWNEPRPFPLNLAEVRKIFYTVFETNRPSKWREILEKRVPLRIGSMSDSFMWLDLKYKVTLELLKILKFYRYPYIVFTRSDLAAHEDYINAMDPKLAMIQYSISGGNEKIARLIEPGAPSVTRRLEALKVLGLSGFWTGVRINPFFPMHPDGYFTDPDSVISRFGSLEKAPKFDFFDWDLIERIKDANVISLLAGVVRLSPFAVRALTKETGMDLASFYKPEMFNKAGDSRYSETEVAYYYKRLKEECDKQGVRFQTCYIGMGAKDYFQYQDLWSNKKDCCDARGKVEGINASSQDVPWDTRMKHASCKESAIKAKEEEALYEAQYPATESHSKRTPRLVKRADAETLI